MTPHDSHHDRSIRVFISSTFRDMYEERELLVKHVFPQLRKQCEARGVAFTDVDLRWGITEEAVQRREVLPVCLAEIERCRPFFIGLLGERYGWVPDRFDPNFIEQQPWLDRLQGCSITELEILHGVLNDPEMMDRACFYFRDPAYIQRIPSDKREDFVEQTPGHREKLKALKSRIRASRAAIREYEDPAELAELVLNDLSAAIDQQYPPGLQLDPLDQEAAAHSAFALGRTGVYIGRPDYFRRLDEHASGDGPPLVLIGESGSGKSALMANWAADYSRSHPGDVLISHFIGASNASTGWARMLRRILSELERKLGMSTIVPENPDDLRAVFPVCLAKAGARATELGQRIILLIDALNQLEDREGALDLVWLPSDLPANVRLVVSSLPGRTLSELDRRGWPALRIEPLTNDEQQRLISEYLAQYTKQLSSARQERIAGSPCASNPLYLRALLEELRVFGIHERLDERIDYYLQASTICALYRRILERWEQDYERDRPGLVRDALSLLWAARHGLSEAELVALLGSNEQPLPHAQWAPLYLAAESALVRRDGLLGFFHDYFRQAVCESYLPDEILQKAAHQRLSSYFKSLDRRNDRRAQELPWQLLNCQQWEELFNVIGQGTENSFNSIWEHNRYDLRTYWKQIEKHTSLKAVDAYRDVTEMSPGITRFFAPQLFHRVAAILSELGYHRETFVLWEGLLAHGELSGDSLAATYANLGATLLNQGHLEDADRALDKAEQLFRETGQQPRLAAVFINRAEIRRLRGDADAAMNLLKEAEKFSREVGDKASLRSCLAAQAQILEETGNQSGMPDGRREEEELCRILGDDHALMEVLESQARAAHQREDLDAAIDSYRGVVELAERLDEVSRLVEPLINLAQLLEYRGDITDAVALYQRAEKTAEALERAHDQALCLFRLGVIHEGTRETEAASNFYNQVEAVARQAGAKELLASALHRQARQARVAGQTETALNKCAEAEALCRANQLDEPLILCLEEHGRVLLQQGDIDGALNLFRQFEQLCDSRDDERGQMRAAFMSGRIHLAKKHLERALKSFRIVERLARKLNDPESLFLGLLQQVRILPSDAEDLRSVRQPLLAELRSLVETLVERQQLDLCSHELENWKQVCISRNDQGQLDECRELLEITAPHR